MRGVDSDYYKNIPVKKLTIVIKPPLWKTWWAYTIYGTLILAVLVVIKRVATTMLRLRQDIAVEKKMADLKLTFFT